MAFKFYLDDQLTDSPIGDTGVITVIRKDQKAGSLLVYQEFNLEYNKEYSLPANAISGYTYLRTIWESGTCNEVELTVYDEVSATTSNLLFKGTVKISDIVYDEQQVTLKVAVTDNSFYAYINNNREIKVNLRANQSKNKLPITALDVYAVDMFNAADGVYGSVASWYFEGIRVVDAFSLIVSVITDNKVGFQSDYLTSSDTEIFLFKGQELLSSFSLYPLAQDSLYEISFQELFDEINIQKNLCYYIDASDPDAPVLRIENIEHLTAGINDFVFEDIKELSTSLYTQKLYSQVIIGSEELVDGPDPIYTLSESTSYFGFKRETFYPLGQCNIAAELSLVNKFIISSNAIQDILIGQNNQFIDHYFLVECNTINTGALTAKAVRYDYFGQGIYFYNQGLNNFSKLQRWQNALASDIGTFVGVGGLGFRALLGDDNSATIIYSDGATWPDYVPPGGLTVDPSPFSNETTLGGYDGSGNYDNVAFEYTLPQNGNYSFLQRLYIGVGSLLRYRYVRVTSTITHYNSSMVVKSVNTTYADYHYAGPYILSHSYALDGVATDIVQASYHIQFFTNPGFPTQFPLPQFVAIGYASYFEANGTPEGTIAPQSSGESRLLIHEFEYAISEEEFTEIRSSPLGVFQFEKAGLTRFGAIEEIRHNNWNNALTKVKLSSNNATLPSQ